MFRYLSLNILSAITQHESARINCMGSIDFVHSSVADGEKYADNSLGTNIFCILILFVIVY